MECSRLRIISRDLQRQGITAYAGKGGRDRVTVLTESLLQDVLNQMRYRLFQGFSRAPQIKRGAFALPISRLFLV